MVDPNDLVSIYQAANVTEAHLVKNLLLDEGIDASVSEEDDPITLPITPSHVLVRRGDDARARVVIDRFDAEQVRRADRPDWVCPACKANVVGSFDECAVCGASRPGSEEDD